MCLMVWIGTTRPVPALAKPTAPTPDAGYHYVEEVLPGAPIRASFTTPHVTYVGSHEGCGCGYDSGDIAWQGVDVVADALALLGALTDAERTAFLAEQRSRERLRALVEAARAEGPVEIYACWAGAEDVKPVATMTIEPAWLTERTMPFEQEGVLYRVARA